MQELPGNCFPTRGHCALGLLPKLAGIYMKKCQGRKVGGLYTIFCVFKQYSEVSITLNDVVCIMI